MALLGSYSVLALALGFLMLSTVSAQDIHIPNYTTMGDCSETCPRHPETKCKFDCLTVTPDGQGQDCINHFYYDDGSIEYHCWE